MHRSKASYIFEFLIHAIFWLGVYYALKALTNSSFQMLVNHNGAIESEDGRMVFPYGWIVLGFLMLLFYSNSFWLFKKVTHYPGLIRRVLVIAADLLSFFFVNYLLVCQLIRRRPHPAWSLPVKSLSVTDWWQMQPIVGLLFVLVLGIAAAYFFFGESIRNELIRSQAEAHQVSTELRFLRSQVNPHFLFNTLNNLFSLAQREGKDNLADKIAKLSGMMRYMIYESNTDRVLLTKEIAYLEDCIALHGMRYVSNQVKISFCHPDPAAIATIRVAPMLFIPFLENAFKHGIAAGHKSCIDMAVSLDQKTLNFTCVNSDYSTVKKTEDESSGIGLENVRRRLELVYPGRHKMRAGPEDGKYIVNLQIDLS